MISLFMSVRSSLSTLVLGSQNPVTFAILPMIDILCTFESVRTVTPDVVGQYNR